MPSIADIRKQWGPDYDSLSDAAIVEHLARENGTDPKVMARVLGVEYQPELGTGVIGIPINHPEQNPQEIQSAAGTVVIAMLIAACCTYALWRLLGGSVKGSTPVATGRRWMNWIIFLTTISFLTKFFSQWIGGYGNPSRALVEGLLGTIILATVAFALGLLVGRFRTGSVGSNTGAPPDVANPPSPLARESAQRVRTAIPVSHPNEPSISPSATTTTENSAPVSSAVDEDAIYAAIATELETGSTDKGLWTRLFVENDGDENRTKVAYIRERAKRLETPPTVSKAAPITVRQENDANRPQVSQPQASMSNTRPSGDSKQERERLKEVQILALENAIKYLEDPPAYGARTRCLELLRNHVDCRLQVNDGESIVVEKGGASETIKWDDLDRLRRLVITELRNKLHAYGPV